jgi:hypothetical protein
MRLLVHMQRLFWVTGIDRLSADGTKPKLAHYVKSSEAIVKGFKANFWVPSQKTINIFLTPARFEGFDS